MIAFQTILCPVDTSAFSERALRHASALGAWYEAEVVVLSVRPTVLPPSMWLAHASALPLEEAGAAAEAEAALTEFVAGVIGPRPVRTMVAEGQVIPEILRVADHLPASLIVMGSHGLGGFDRFVLGSVTEKVLRKASCPVLVIPGLAEGAVEPPHVTFGTIVCGLDRSTSSTRALEYALSLAQQAGGRLVLVHALEDFADEDPRFAQHFNIDACWRAAEPEIRADYEALVPAEARAWCDITLQTPRGKSYRAILESAAKCHAELIVLGTAGWNAPFGSTTQHVVRQAACPVLVVPSPRG